MEEMRVKTTIITKSSRFAEIENPWNELVRENSENPFLFSAFVMRQMTHKISEGWTPNILVISGYDGFLGFVPLVKKRKFGIYVADFLVTPSFSPDLVVQRKYKYGLARIMLETLFERQSIHFVEIVMELDSLNLRPLLDACEEKGVCVFVQYEDVPLMNHTILNVDKTWKEFCELRGTKFRRRLKVMQQKLQKTGQLTIRYYQNEEIDKDAIKKVFEIERNSWKQDSRARKRRRFDRILNDIIEASQQTVKVEPDFRYELWILELDKQPISYCLAVQYKKTVFFPKSSFDERYRKLSPGIYVLNEAYHAHFDRDKPAKIDFMTKFPHYHIWSDSYLPRVRIIMSKGLVPKLIGMILAHTASRKTIRRILSFSNLINIQD